VLRSLGISIGRRVFCASGFVMTEPKKLSTAEILALARQKKADAAAAAEGAPALSSEAPGKPVAPSEPVAAAEAPATPAAPAAPKSTADILAAARASKAGGAAAPAGGAPKSTADILAAARAGAKPAAAAPKSTADILAAARAAKASGGGAAQPGTSTAAAPAAEKKAAVAAGGVGPAGANPSVEAMLKAVRSGTPMTAEPAKPRLPAKPPVLVAKTVKGESRRSFVETALSPFYIGFAVLAAWTGVGSLAMARFMMPNTVLELPSKFKVGSSGDYPLGTVSEKYKASRGVWIVHTDSYDGRNIVYALASVCTHLGCTPNWLDAEQKFKCPCHGSGFYINGINFEGPAPRPLERVGLRVSEDGQLEVDKSLKFQEELGQWSDDKSFVVLS
jgi:cytochrome b6-f complex iron-sulfur subunit